MKLEQQDVQEDTVMTPQNSQSPRGKKPVIIYIMILFIAAFLLMALSSLMHQRTNSEMLGELQDSVSAMQEVQATQDKIIDLQEQLNSAEDTIASLEKQLEEQEALIQEEQQTAQALLALYTLQQEFLTQDFDGCRTTLQEIADNGWAELLPDESVAGVTSPAQRYQELKEAVLNQ